ncbi:hypothetical protein PUNSTDRAFT_50411 [Punctularia strigosozonata HHB-11173 SS5]|uniref:uncharacterized protein n=1 Tax=Punctularia strigosozonata (strain HHB-11173) TaxID=741275 RepID=UPI00044169E1|nr:uncharacterized protein PUNSTDRAFT_50411 [Punctularia strigosozonata HHB-11173 SS5]EIN11402.1 hypothetical protein PUNSTDRAFT_50411 [Punctularia strigosozonata HHB-11173 SS5]
MRTEHVRDGKVAHPTGTDVHSHPPDYVNAKHHIEWSRSTVDDKNPMNPPAMTPPGPSYERLPPSQNEGAGKHNRETASYRGPSYAESHDDDDSNNSTIGIMDTVTPGGGRQSGSHDWKRDDVETSGTEESGSSPEDLHKPSPLEALAASDVLPQPHRNYMQPDIRSE